MGLLSLTAIAIGAATFEANSLAVPRGRAPALDGVVRPGEWKGAATRPLAGGGLAHFLHDGTDLYVGLSDLPGSGFGYGVLMLGTDDSVLVLHASAKVGSAVYSATGEKQNRRWRPASKSYAWKEGTRLYDEEGWMADIAPKDGAKGREFRVARRLLAGRRLAIAYLVQTAGNQSLMLRLPASLAIDRGLPDGWNPDSLAIETQEWLSLRRL